MSKCSDLHEFCKQIMLSLCSRRTEVMISYAKVKCNSIELHINMCSSTLEIESRNHKMYHCGPDQRIKGSNKLAPPVFSRWIDKNFSSFQNCVSILKHLQNMISFKSLILYVNLEFMTAQFFKEILTEPALRDFEFLSLDRGKIDAECLDLVMETAHSNRDLHINYTKVPENYHHKNAFKFYVCGYWDSRWVRVEDLFTLKDSFAVSLGRNKLSSSDVNTFLKFWMENDHDMVQRGILDFRTAGVLQTERLFDGILVLQGRRNHLIAYLVAANPTKQRKHQIMGVVLETNRLRLYSWDKNEPIRFEENVYAESWAPEYKVLQALNQQKELEGKLEEIQNLLETSQDQNMVKKKNEIERDLQNVSQELAGYNLVFRDSVYSYE
ncbi:hypothetical protein CAEBREN_17187 [Caenorhabditis brenneri]|uniref:Sdz-33 F-box domain-containing protein n=1 Tax=Caenorhabditis brenneri TaxID=135651 RepID=G0MFQ6_CAEBE|nr:hypothetical protein CAEBREN_17187 [Caenorhabditis brenneri]